jgi:hypothetical protein
MKKFVILAFILLVFISQTGLADGWHPSQSYLHLHEPNQKAIISWADGKETMVLVSSVTMDEIDNFAWVVPIQSSIKPEITEGNISIFRSLVHLFEEPYDDDISAGKKDIDGIQIIETKEIGIYDITILKADTSDVLMKWLNENDYLIPDNAKPVLDYYVKKPDFYFVTNKIDLKNKYEDLLNYDINDIKEMNNKFMDGQKYFYRSHNFVLDILTGVNYNKSHFRNFPISLESDYNDLKQKYYSPNNEKFRLIFDNMDDYDDIDFDKFNVINEHSYTENIDEASDTISISFYEQKNSTCNGGICSGIQGKGVNLKKLDIEELGLTPEEYFEFIKENHKKFFEDYDNVYNELSEIKNHHSDYFHTLNDLKRGVGTPLKFEFYPEKPYYPLEISSLGAGETHIEVYVASYNPVIDLSGILNNTKSKLLTNSYRNDIDDHIDLGNARYVTRLTFEGDLSELLEDAVFDEEDISSFEHFMDIFQSWFSWFF